MKVETGNIIKIYGMYYEVTGTELMEGYGLIEAVALNDSKAVEIKLNVEDVELAWELESSLTSKIEKIKAEFSDECINEKLRTPDVKSGMIEMRDEILNRLK